MAAVTLRIHQPQPRVCASRCCTVQDNAVSRCTYRSLWLCPYLHTPAAWMHAPLYVLCLCVCRNTCPLHVLPSMATASLKTWPLIETQGPSALSLVLIHNGVSCMPQVSSTPFTLTCITVQQPHKQQYQSYANMRSRHATLCSPFDMLCAVCCVIH